MGCLALVLLIVLCVSLCLNFIQLMPSSQGVARFETVLAAPAQAGKEGSHARIALISLRGIISSSYPGALGETMVDDLKMQLSQAVEDDRVKAVVLVIDSPGGEVTASDTIYQAVRSVRDGTKKPVVVYMDSLAASGGYYVACGGSFLIANETTLTGSIGVIMQAFQYKELFDKVGLKTLTFKSGKFKDMLSGSRATTPEEEAYVQSMVDETYGKFVGIVAQERKLDEATLRTGIADGRVVSGKVAMESKLIDGLGTVESAIAKAKELAQVPGAAVVRYDAGIKLGRLLRILGKAEKNAGKIEVSLSEGARPKLEAGRLYFLPAFLAE